MQQQVYDVIIAGGGLAGLCCALHLSQHDVDVLLIEQKEYPHHKVCGEYVSNEVLPYLKSLGIDPMIEGAVPISKFEISTKNGKKVSSNLPLGGFGVSRFAFDQMIARKLVDNSEILKDKVTSIAFHDDTFSVITRDHGLFRARFVVGAFGKRSFLDKALDRDFMKERTHWMAVKGHFEYDFPEDTVALHNFEGGYCGLSKTETGAVNACYLTRIKSFNQCENLESFQQTVMSKNPYLKDFFSKAKPLFKKSLTISQISFAKKSVIHDHIFMLGDSAGLIHPLCGNGMAMAIHAAKLFSELFTSLKDGMVRDHLERSYIRLWNENFSSRLRTGNLIQKILLNDTAASLAFTTATLFPSMLPAVIKKTHGVILV